MLKRGLFRLVWKRGQKGDYSNVLSQHLWDWDGSSCSSHMHIKVFNTGLFSD